MSSQPPPAMIIEYRGFRLTAFRAHEGWKVLVSREGGRKNVFVAESSYEAAIQKAKSLIDQDLFGGS